MKPRTLDELYRMHVRDVYGYLCFLCRDLHTAEDLTQETFYRAYLYLEDWKEERIRPWLFRVAYNAFVDYKRKERRSVSREPRFFDSLSHANTPEQSVLHRERIKELECSIAALPDNQRLALLLHETYGFTYREAADIMGAGLPQYKIWLYRARQKLRMERAKEEERE